MEKFNTLEGIAAPMPLINIDTDMLIPKQFLKTIKRTGLGENLFFEMRYDQNGNKIKDFILNKEHYKNASIIVGGANFGCGSSREHAPWALKDFGINVVIASSFGDIFFNNCFKNGVLAVKVSQESLNEIFKEQKENFQKQIEIDLINQKIKIPNIKTINFDIDDFRKNCLLEGLDDIGFSLKYESEITNYENKLKKLRPWILND